MEIRTLCDIFYNSVENLAKPEHLKYKRDGVWKAISSQEFKAAVEELSAGLRELGIERGDRVAILSENRPEWAWSDLAILCAAAIDVPIYPTLPAPHVLYILNDSQSKLALVSNALQARKIADVRAQTVHLKHVIRLDPEPIEGTLSLEEVRAKGREALARDKDFVRRRALEAKADDLATLIYTSGTTGDPKGVMLLHSNLVSNVTAATVAFGAIGPEDTCLSFLPLSHVFERMGGHYLMLLKGVTIAYAESFEKLADNMLEVRPTILLSVPRLYEKIYARVLERVSGDPPLRQRIFHWAVAVGRRVFRHFVEGTSVGPLLGAQHKLAQALVFSKIQARTGGRLRVAVSGGAPLGREIAEFFGAIGILILEGYGLTETSPVIAVNVPGALRPGSVGKPLPGVEVRIAEDGEILTRGPHVMKGYFGKPEATTEAIDPDGWFHTGDIGVLDKDGFLVITDRKKDIIVTSGGKNIAPQPIENLLKSSKLIAEVVMIGNKRNFPAALLIPNFEALEKWAAHKGLSYKTREELVALPDVRALYDDTIREMSQELAQFERIKKVGLLSREFSIETGELTPKLSVKRRVVEQKYQDLIDRLYAAGGA
ncbi:MAG: long-chain fatty acid--CoA ligase [Vicinamibacteria bacterium]